MTGWRGLKVTRQSPAAVRKPVKAPRKAGRRGVGSTQTLLDPFLGLCKGFGVPVPVKEHRFAAPRRFRFDYAWVEQRVALEVDGGLFSGGGHVRGAHILTTHEKMNLAAGMGWRIFYTTPRQLTAMLPLLKETLAG